ncbi:hypothetical protein J7384_09405 [Endozoicomonas sp. G2_1]|uniref:hypothetical protein n=1 Tax=Endozoicomonas sp. G2_1 TaxID=2821091 RepID=UPI001ADC36D2|nr:hypothetical protein [Endozoicomonas sp. G2_1]MBO9490579.1 hypothetical protein [Endozoicomonas sp. G2_1]
MAKSSSTMPYCIEHKRELNDVEREILYYLVRDSGLHEYESQIQELKIIARCGCGSCPTVLFGNTFESKPAEPSSDLARYMGMSSNGTTVGIALMGTETKLTELEAWSCCGGEFDTWPDISTFVNMNNLHT